MLLRKISFVLISSIILALTTLSCEDETSITAAQRSESEKQLYTQYLEENFDSLSNISIRTIGNKTDFDLVYWETKAGYVDVDTTKTPTIVSGNLVAVRYSLWDIDVDQTTYKTVKVLRSSNIDNATPDEFYVDYSTSGVASYKGLNDAIKYMRQGTKAYFLMPSTLTDYSYYSSLFEVEVVYVSH